MRPKYEFITLVVSGDILGFKQRYPNQFSTPDKILIGSEGDRRFIVTWDAKTFLDMEDDKIVYLIRKTMNEIDSITKDPDPNMEMVFRAINASDDTSIIDMVVSGKFDRIMKLLKKKDESKYLH